MSPPRPCGSLAAGALRASGKRLIRKVEKSQNLKQNFIKHKLLQSSLPKGSEGASMAADVSTRSVSKVTGFWKVRVGRIL